MVDHFSVTITEELVRRTSRPAFIAPLARVARGAGRLLLNGLATRAGAIGGFPALRTPSVPPTTQGR